MANAVIMDKLANKKICADKDCSCEFFLIIDVFVFVGRILILTYIHNSYIFIKAVVIVNRI